ncbi:zinc finger CCHC-type protein [Fadolivirus algeromassiliense]|jgi:hypothetical protein|uniref:Zinc finger CCHC-type protein n=1 Tax=Fadolivirus FV1/VV64 TaxID=3070911 RepID=A0A7D3UW57_9VIRU|nr:zinc finger CCHC-type protein [Fadolivirus algeromassiliense]QKF94549.1 zinc finger CCHC-type protein [Fadolivirus FV1/VV64]
MESSQQISDKQLSQEQIRLIELRVQHETVQQQLQQSRLSQEPIKTKIQVLKEQIEELQKQLSPMSSQEWSLVQTIHDLDYQIQDQQKEIWWEGAGLSISTIKTSQLKSLPAKVIDIIVKRKYDVDKLKFYSSIGTESGRPEVHLSPKEYVESVIHRITKYESCTYCHSVYHMKDTCPELEKKKCVMCHESGHDQYHCTKQVKDLYKKRSVKYRGSYY